MKPKYRSSLGITGEILQACMNAGLEGIMISQITRSVNLSHKAAKENCLRLTDAGMIQSVKKRRTQVYLITEKGIRFFREFQKFQDTIKKLKIKY